MNCCLCWTLAGGRGRWLPANENAVAGRALPLFLSSSISTAFACVQHRGSGCPPPWPLLAHPRHPCAAELLRAVTSVLWQGERKARCQTRTVCIRFADTRRGFKTRGALEQARGWEGRGGGWPVRRDLRPLPPPGALGPAQACVLTKQNKTNNNKMEVFCTPW